MSIYAATVSASPVGGTSQCVKLLSGGVPVTRTETLYHGDWDHRMPTAPEVGDRISFEKVSIDLIPPSSMEVNFVADQDVITIPLGFTEWTKAYDTDKRTSLENAPGQANAHFFGAECYAKTVTPPCEMIGLFVDPSLRAAISNEIDPKSLPSQQRIFGALQTPMAGAHARMIRKMHLSGLIQGRLAAESLATLVLSDILNTLADTDPNSTKVGRLPPHTLNLLFERIDAHLDENFGLTNMASAVDMSPYHFSRAFKNSTGLTPHQYVIERRIARAREMMLDANLTLADIAYACGFSSQAHMSDVFRKKLGVTPGSYRDLVRE